MIVACVHGTRSARGRSAVERFVAELGSQRTEAVELAFIDVADPTPTEVIAAVRAGRSAAHPDAQIVLLPVLLSSGYHVHVDLAEAAASASGVRVAPTLGPDPRIAQVMARRLREAGALADAPGVPNGPVVLGAVGSSDPRSRADVESAAAQLAAEIGGPVHVGYVTREPRVGDVLAHLTGRRGGPGATPAAGGRAVIAPYVLGEGFAMTSLRRAGAPIVAAPLLSATHDVPPELLALAQHRLRAADAHPTAG